MMANSPIVLRASPEDFVEITNIQQVSERSNYSSLLSVHSGRFSCLRHPFHFDDLDGFTEAIAEAYDRIEGKAHLAHKYEKDIIGIEVLKTGQVSLEGFI